MKVEVCIGDITKEKTDVIVNAANKSLLGGGGVDGAIHEAAGPQLLEECQRLNGCPVGRVRITSGYNLHANYIIHTTGPRWNTDGNEDACKNLLRNCYWKSLVLAKTQGLKSISFPCISTGVYHFPKDLAAQIALATVQLYEKKCGGKDDQTIELIRFVCFGQEDFDIYVGLGVSEGEPPEEDTVSFIEEDMLEGGDDLSDDSGELSDDELEELLGDKKKVIDTEETVVKKESSQEELKEVLEKANEEYRTTGDTSLTDEQYDYLLDQVEDEEFKNKVGVEVTKNKVDLPVSMGSMNKIKTDEEISSWKTSKKISGTLLVTPKFDGNSLLVSYEKGEFVGAYTRGNGKVGQDVTEHFRYTKLGKKKLPEDFTGHVVGEAIMKDKVFDKKYKDKYKNPRNMVAGLLGRKEISEELYDVDFMAFRIKSDVVEFKTRSAEIGFLNKYNNSNFGFLIEAMLLTDDQITRDKMQKVYDNLDTYQFDGVIMEINSLDIQESIGLETNSLNPSFARAWKPESDDSKTTEVIGISWSVSKQGYVKPVVNVKPVDLVGVTISNVTGNNAKYIQDNHIGIGSHVTIIRSGDVIPKIIDVVMASNEDGLCESCPSCEGPLKWNSSRVELVCENKYCDEKVISQNVEFFKIMGVEEVGEGVVKQLYDAGFKSIPTILSSSQDEFKIIEGFGDRKAEIVYTQIHSKMNDVPLYTLQHASNLFKGLGERKLKLLEQYDSPDKMPSLDDITSIDGYSTKTAKVYLDAFDEFWDFYHQVMGFVNIRKYIPPVVGPLTGKTFVFTGGKPKDLVGRIEDMGGKIGSSVSAKAFAVIVKEKGSGSSKENKAIELGLQLWTREEAKEWLDLTEANNG